MRPTLVLAVASLASLAACGKKHPTATGGGDGGPTVFMDAPQVDATIQAACTPVHGTTIAFKMIATVTGGATLVTSPPNDPRLFVLEQQGRIRVIANGQLQDKVFLDITPAANGPVLAGGEQGLLGLAFHPNYATNGLFYVAYTATNPDATDTGNPYVDVIARYQVSATDPNKADVTTGTIILSIPDYASNHNGGMLEFGSDNYLYEGTGDGGNAGGVGGDPHFNAQNTNALLGKMLRIDVDHPANGKPYGIPADNPYATTGGAPEVFMIGLRNPWRWSFDRANGNMWIADVGQDVIEELDVLPAGTQNGANLGWSVYEGNNCCLTESGQCEKGSAAPACVSTGMTFPKFTMTHPTWDAIIGGQVYRGTCFPDLVGTYFFSDNGAHPLAMATLNGDNSVTVTMSPTAAPASPSSLHADSTGELYLTDTAGNVYHLTASGS